MSPGQKKREFMSFINARIDEHEKQIKELERVYNSCLYSERERRISLVCEQQKHRQFLDLIKKIRDFYLDRY